MALNIGYTCDGPGCQRQGHASEDKPSVAPDGWIRVGNTSWSPVFHSYNCLTQWARHIEQKSRIATEAAAYEMAAWWKSTGQA